MSERQSREEAPKFGEIERLIHSSTARSCRNPKKKPENWKSVNQKRQDGETKKALAPAERDYTCSQTHKA